LHKEQLSENMITQLKQAKETCEGIQKRYEEQLSILESVQSELHMAQRLVEVLESHIATFEEEMGELKGILHPIRRCPPELLKCIFEFTLPPIDFDAENPPSSRMWQANQVAQVCRYWRDIALETPSLWDDIQVDFRLPPELVEGIWERAVKRVKGAPATVRFDNIGGNEAIRGLAREEQMMRRCNLREIPNLDVLRLTINYNIDTVEALSLITSFPTCKMSSMEIIGYGLTASTSHPDWDWATFLHRFPRARFIELTLYDENLAFTTSTPFLALEELKLSGGCRTNLFELLKYCPNLQRLSLEFCEETGSPGSQTLIMPNLTHLELSYSDLVWDSIQLPSLSTFLYIDDNPFAELRERVVGFIAAHPSLINLSISAPRFDLVELSGVAPQVAHLTLDVETFSIQALFEWQEVGSGPTFPNLTTLEIKSYDDDANYTCSLADFENLVRTRCLPPTHVESNFEANLVSIENLVISAPGGWKDSKYLADATLITTEGQTNVSTTMTWL
jgi:hypothetical protein